MNWRNKTLVSKQALTVTLFDIKKALTMFLKLWGTV